MQALRNGYGASKGFASSVIEFRSAASPAYWMVVNSAFWWSAFYLGKEYQMRLLISMAACIFGWDVLLSSSHEHSPLVHLLLWPFRETIRSIGTALTLFSAYYLKNAENEAACRLAYASLFLFMINPVLNHQRVPQRVFNLASSFYCKAVSFFVIVILRPSIAIYKVVEYIIFLRWIKVIYAWLRDAIFGTGLLITRCYRSFILFNKNLLEKFVSSIVHCCMKCRNAVFFIWHSILDSLLAIWAGFHSLLRSTWKSIINGFFAFWHSLINGIKAFYKRILGIVVSVTNGIRSGIFSIYSTTAYRLRCLQDGIVNFVLSIWFGFLNGIGRIWKGGVKKMCYFRDGVVNLIYYYLHGLKAFFSHILNAARQLTEKLFLFIKQVFLTCLSCLENNFFYPLKNAWIAVKSFLTYWFCAQWWPALKLWLKKFIGEPLERGFNYACFGLVYVFCFYWFRPCASFCIRKMIAFTKFALNHLRLIWDHVERALLAPFYKWVRNRLNDLLIIGKNMLHKLAVIFKDSVLWPVCIFFAGIIRKIGIYIKATVFQPVINWFYQKYKFVEDYILIYILAPACTLIINSIPDKSPFCDDSDTELAGFLPEEDNSDTTDSDSETRIKTVLSRSHSESPLSEDENELMHGLIFPSVEASESSDDEFTVKKTYTSRKKRLKSKKSKESSFSIPQDTKLDVIFSEDEGLKHSNSSDHFIPDADQLMAEASAVDFDSVLGD